MGMRIGCQQHGLSLYKDPAQAFLVCEKISTRYTSTFAYALDVAFSRLYSKASLHIS